MRSLAFTFGRDTLLDLQSEVSGIACEGQNALVNTVTAQGSDPLFPDRGTRLRRSVVQGGFIDQNSATHTSQISAVQTLLFIHNEENQTDSSAMLRPDLLTGYDLAPIEMENQRVRLNAFFTTADGSTLGINITA